MLAHVQPNNEDGEDEDAPVVVGGPGGCSPGSSPDSILTARAIVCNRKCSTYINNESGYGYNFT